MPRLTSRCRPSPVRPSGNVGDVTAGMEMLSTEASASTCAIYGDPYDLYLMERSCCEAEENDDDASHRLEAAYLSQLRDSLFGDPVQPIGTKRRERSTCSPWLPRSSTTTPTSVAMMDASMLMSSISVTNSDGLTKRSKRVEQEEEKTPELTAWAIAAAEQAASSAKRARREFWSTAGVDVEALRSMTIR